jgi:Domain of unknown function (DU1801)
MQSKAKSPQEYYQTLPEDRREAMMELRRIIAGNLPKGFAEVMQYGMPGWVVPHSLYPAGYHCDPKQALPFLSIASQKQYIAVYHMGLYADTAIHKWFAAEYAKQAKGKLDMGKSCIRFKKPDQIPMKLIGELASKVTPKKWIEVYEKNLKR